MMAGDTHTCGSGSYSML